MATGDSISRWGCGSIAAPTSLTPYRLYQWSGSPPTPSLCAAGADADGVTSEQFSGGSAYALALAACPGGPVQVEAGAAFSAGALLQSDSSGRAITQTTGKAVLRALGAASAAGNIVWCVFTSGR